MGAIALLPGTEQEYVTETFDEDSASAADTVDATQLNAVSIQQEFVTGTPGGTFNVERNIGRSGVWEVIRNNVAVADGAVTSLILQSDGVLGNLRIDPAGITGTGVGLRMHFAGFVPVR